MGTSRRSKMRTWLAVGCVCLLVVLGLLSGVLDIGDRLMRSSAVLGVVFYALVVALVLAGVVWPLVSVLGRPVFSLARLHDGRGRARALWCRRLAANLRDNVELDQEQLARLEACTAGPDTSQQLAELYRELCVPRVNARIKKSAVGACAATAISQTGVYDALSMLSINFALVRGIVTDCGFRPSNVQLARIYLRVMAGALLAGGLEELDLEEMLPLVLGQATSKVSGVLLASTAQGMVNAFTTYRVGVMTKHLLFDEDEPSSQLQVRRVSYGEAISLMKETDFYSEMFHMVGERLSQARSAAWNSVRSSVKNAGESWLGRVTSGFARRGDRQAEGARGDEGSSPVPKDSDAGEGALGV